MEALPWIQAAVGIGKIIQGSKTPQKPPTLGYDEAVQRASGVIDQCMIYGQKSFRRAQQPTHCPRFLRSAPW